MSAFMVSHAHINTLLTFACAKRLQNELSYCANKSANKTLDWTAIGKILLDENARSIFERYPDCSEDNMPGTIDETPKNYCFRHAQELASMPYPKMLATIIKACHCFDYQACETDDYEQSIAHSMIRAIEARAIRALPHYENAPWGI